MEKVICITGNFPTGQRIVAAKAVYDQAIDPSSVSAESYQVEGRTIREASVQENTVLLTLDEHEKNAAVFVLPDFKGPGPGGPGKPGGPGGPGKPGGPGRPGGMPKAQMRPVEVKVAQVREIKTISGETLPGSGDFICSSEKIQPVVDDFVQGEYKGLPYNLFSPKNAENGKCYPLVVFVPDGGAAGEDVMITLAQGNGAVAWAEAAWQEKHPCYVLAPQPSFAFRFTNDEEETATDKLFILKELIDHVAEQNAVDKARIYCTGQSGGGMCFAEMNIQFPKMFAAAMFVACQWNAARFAAACRDKKFWTLVSHDDAKAFPGWNAMMEALEQAGAKVGRYEWDAKESSEMLEAHARQAAADGCPIHYTVFSGSSVVPEDRAGNPMNNHHFTWPIAYGIDAVKEWIFAQSLEADGNA